MTKYFILILALVAASVSADSEKFITGRVKTDNELNVRVKPGKQYFVVAALKHNDKVKIFRKVDDWYEIAAPADSSVWVAGHLMTNSRTRREVNLRAGPSSDYQAYRTEPAGIELEVIEREGHGGWFKVKPPVDLKAWVSSRFIDVDADELKELQGLYNKSKLILIDTETGNFAGFLKGDKDAKPPFILPFVKGADREITLRGQIVPLKPGAVYVTHALISISREGDVRPVAYLHCQKASLNIWQDRLLTVAGVRKLVDGWKLPVIEVETIIPEQTKIQKSEK